MKWKWKESIQYILLKRDHACTIILHRLSFFITIDKDFHDLAQSVTFPFLGFHIQIIEILYLIKPIEHVFFVQQ